MARTMSKERAMELMLHGLTSFITAAMASGGATKAQHVKLVKKNSKIAKSVKPEKAKPGRKPSGKACSECKEPALAKGLCRSHYQKARYQIRQKAEAEKVPAVEVKVEPKVEPSVAVNPFAQQPLPAAPAAAPQA